MANKTGVSPDILPLPSGGGSVSSIGETFNADLFTGTGSYSVPLWFPIGPGGFTPEHSLEYSTGSGNGPFGLGWQMSLLQLRRQTDRGVPRYDATDSLIFAGEELAAMPDGSYRAHKETRFNRIEPKGSGFEVKTPSGVTFDFGLSAIGREENTGSGKTRTSAWVLEKATDAHGNSICYKWFRDQGRLYLRSILYGPYEICFHYSAREDVHSNCRTGYAITTGQRCDNIEYRLVTDGDSVIRCYEITYEQDHHSRLSLLSQIEEVGERDVHGTVETAKLPKLQFSYQPFELDAHYVPYQVDDNVAEPPAQQNQDTNLVDMKALGLPGIIQVDGPLRRFWPGRTQGRFGRPGTIADLPNGLHFADQPVAFADMDGTGTADVVLLAESPLGYLKNEAGQGWSSQRQPFTTAPSFNINDPEVRLVDLNGDGRVDVIRSSEHYFYIYLNDGGGWSDPILIPRIHDMTQFPDLFFSDSRVQFADMTGDGLMDLVWVHGSRIDYWPGLGNGQFMERRQLKISPSLASGFKLSRLFLADINGNGLSDLIYVEQHRVKIWINQNGNAFSYAGAIQHTPLTDGTNIRIADMEGIGVAGVLWSYPPGQVAGGNYKYLAFTGRQKPFLMAQINNGLGMTTHIQYDSTARQAQQAIQENQAWETSIPFPVQVVSRIEEVDSVSGAHTRRAITYRNGSFDGTQRKFLGFEKVEVLEMGDMASPSSETISWFHQGRTGLSHAASGAERRALAGRLHRVEIRDLGMPGDSAKLMRQEQNEYEVKYLGTSTQGESILFPHLSSTRVENLEGQAAGATVLTSFVYDDFGNITGRDEQWDSAGTVQIRRGEFRYSSEVATNKIKNAPLEYLERDDLGNLLRLKRYYYDGTEFTGLPLGQVNKGNLSRVEQLVFTDALFNSIYSGLALNPVDFGYHPINLSSGDQGWATNSLRQRHDSRGNILARQDAFDNIGTIGYDPSGIAPVEITDPVGLQYQGIYDYRAARLSQVSDPNGNSTSYQFDPVGRLKAVIKPGDTDTHPTQTITHITTSLPAVIRTQLRETTGTSETVDSYEYVDGKGNVIQRRSEAENGQILVDGWRSYNSRGWESERSIPFFSTGVDFITDEGSALAQRFRFQYDGLGRIIATQTPDGHRSKILFAPMKISRYDVTDMDDSSDNIARGHFDTPRVEEIDAKGNMVTVVEMNADRSTIRTEYQRDAMGQLSGITDSRGVQSARYVYDLLGRKIYVNHVDAGIRRRLFDSRGDISTHYDALDRSVDMAYDAARRKTEVKVDGIVEETYQYDTGSGSNLLGRLSQVVDVGGNVSISYTQRGLIESRTREMTTLAGSETFAEQFTYDSMERVTQVTRPDGSKVQYQYDERGLAFIPGVVNGIQRNALGQLTRVTLANGITEEYSFDANSFYLSGIEISRGASSLIFNTGYTYDAAGNPLDIQDHVVAADHVQYNRQFKYDALSRLNEMTGDHAGTVVQIGYKYDAAGNFIHNDTFSSDDLFLETADSNRIAGVKAASGDTILFGYSANGAMVNSPGRTCEFDARGRLTRATMSTGNVVEYFYGYDGARVQKRITKPGQPDRESLYISEYFERLDGIDTGSVLAEGRRIAAQTISEGTHYLHRDHLGNIVLITDNTGNKVGEIGYRPFGGALFNTLRTNIAGRGFIGCEQDDETGLVYCAARYYDPGLGRFISPDPYLLYAPEESLILPANLNLYTYAANNPMRQIDNAGTFWKWIVGALIIVALVVATVIVGIATGGAGFAFGILLAASIGSALGAGMGVASAAMAGGSVDDMANGFLFGAIIGGAAGAAGYAAGAAVGAIGISGVWGTILAGAAQGALIGAGNGAIIGYAGGTGSVEDIFIHMGAGFLVGAVTGGLAGYLSYDPSVAGSAVNEAISTGTASATDPITGVVTSQTNSTGLEALGQAAGNFTTQLVETLAHPIIFASVGSVHHLVVTYYWDDIKTALLDAFGGEEEEIIITI